MRRKLNIEPIKEMASTGREALKRNSREHDCGHLGLWKKQMSAAVGSSIGMLICGGIAIVALKRAIDTAHRHQEWHHEDSDLDARLAESMDASDAVARY